VTEEALSLADVVRQAVAADYTREFRQYADALIGKPGGEITGIRRPDAVPMLRATMLSHHLTLSRQQAIEYGIVQETPEEVAQREAATARYRAEAAAARKAAAWGWLDAYRAAPDATARRILAEHRPGADGNWPVCGRCVHEDSEYGDTPASWPCETVGYAGLG
jgi:enoyl-CoA hydratase/carnithine racemase